MMRTGTQENGPPGIARNAEVAPAAKKKKKRKEREQDALRKVRGKCEGERLGSKKRKESVREDGNEDSRC